MQIYLVRHGETNFNVLKRFQDSKSELSIEGERQAHIVANRLTKIKIDKIISSPFKRTQQTAQIIANKIGKEIEYCDLFKEIMAPTIFIGKDRSHPDVQSILLKKRENFHNIHFKHSDEETLSEIKIRCLSALEMIKKQTVENLLIVAHGAIINALVAVMMFGEDISTDEYYKFIKFHHSANTGITLVSYTSEWKLETWNDKAHLG